jgi:NAD(P)-dependent dehydrogenase (short-subunit alcohol dehydrogenase family)
LTIVERVQALHAGQNQIGFVRPPILDATLFTQRQTTVDGLEMTFALDYLAYFLLTNLLLDTMKASTPARIINIASALQGIGKIHFDDLQSEKSYGAWGFRAYSQAKLANVIFTYDLARRLAGTGITVNAVGLFLLAPSFLTALVALLAQL